MQNTRSPAFMIIGAARCGTSSLHRNLLKHPDIEGPSMNRIKGNNKEIHYFDKKWARPFSWYLDCWEPEKASSLLFESTPNYLYHERCPAAMKELLPDCKFIIMLRNPLDRAWSHFWHWKYTKKNNWPLSRLLDPNDVIIQKGIYWKQLFRWHAQFPKKQFLIMKSEDYYANERAVIKAVFKWLGVRPITLSRPEYYDPVYNARRPKKDALEYGRMPKDIRISLGNFYEQHNQKLYEYMEYDFGWKKEGE